MPKWLSEWLSVYIYIYKCICTHIYIYVYTYTLKASEHMTPPKGFCRYVVAVVLRFWPCTRVGKPYALDLCALVFWEDEDTKRV